MNWFERSRQREYEFARGVDADLVADNQKRYRFVFVLFAFGFALGLIVSKVRLPSTLHLIVVVIATLCLIGGLALAVWARQESAFLSKPETENPPKIFR
jgi:hypothetical protein